MGELSHFIYSSRQMVDVPTFYFDTMIMDSSLGKNQFNMPVITR